MNIIEYVAQYDLNSFFHNSPSKGQQCSKLFKVTQNHIFVESTCLFSKATYCYIFVETFTYLSSFKFYRLLIVDLPFYNIFIFFPNDFAPLLVCV